MRKVSLYIHLEHLSGSVGFDLSSIPRVQALPKFSSRNVPLRFTTKIDGAANLEIIVNLWVITM